MKYLNVTPDVTDKNDWKTLKTASVSGYGSNTIEDPPWLADGYTIFGHGGTDHSPERRWGLNTITPKIPIVKWVADFYLLEAIAMQIPQGKTWMPPFSEATVLDFIQRGHRPTHRKDDTIQSLWAMYLQARLVDYLAPVLRNYMYYACAGEASHHKFFRRWMPPGDEQSVRWKYKAVLEKVGGPLAAKWLSDTFYDGHTEHKDGDGKTYSITTHWGTSGDCGYGGLKWGQCSDVLRYYEIGRVGSQPFTAKNFCDRVFSLQHNGGTILSKTYWDNADWTTLLGVLNAHNHGNYDLLKQHATPLPRTLWDCAATLDLKDFHTGYNWGDVKYPRLNKNASDPYGDSGCDCCDNDDYEDEDEDY